MITCQAAVLRELQKSRPYEESQPLQLETVTLAGPGRSELLVKVLAAGLCHSDLSVIDGSRIRPLPMVLGHEACGEVVEVGDGVDHTKFAVGDRVIFSFVPSCGQCLMCAQGRAALCEFAAKANGAGSLLSGERRFNDAEGHLLHHHLGVSAFSQMTVVSVCSAVKIDDDLDPKIAALFGCAVMTGVGAVVNTANVSPGESVIIFGMGGVGLAALLGALATSAYPVICVDILDAKLDKARELGATHVLNAAATSAEDVISELRKLTAGGAQYVFETVGNEVALNQAYQVTGRGGTTVAVGLPHPAKQFSVSAASLVAEERTVKGSYMGSAVPLRDIPRLINLYRAGKLPVDKLVSHTLSLKDINLGFDQLAQGVAIRQIIEF